MEHNDCGVIVLADAPGALTELCGMSILERLLRTLQRLDVGSVTVVSETPDVIRAAIERPSWARAELSVIVRDSLAPVHRRALVVSAAYYDARLLAALLNQQTTTLLGDHGAHCGAALIDPSWSLARPESLFHELSIAAKGRQIQTLELASLPAYITSMRRSIPPLYFPPPTTSSALAVAERHVLDAAQNGTLDLPALVHAPIETCIIRRLCWTSVTPNQITLFTAAVSALVVLLFVSGQLVAGTVLAFVVGVLDGLDGKQARVKVETTPLGQREHALDYVLELSWWTALAFHIGNVWHWLLLLVATDIIDRIAKSQVKQLTGRNLDDVAPFDRFVRLVGGRRNIYIWMFAAGLLLRAADKAFVALCCWGAVTATLHVARALWISSRRSERAAH
ncbi:MAG: CDP-alcohol phosphatidyltransferase family protein [Chthoniobacterales bacterium]